MNNIKVEVIPSGVTNNPDNGILPNEKIKTSDFKQTLKLLDNLYPVKDHTRSRYTAYCSCKLNKSEKAHDHVKLHTVNVNSEGLCDNCNHIVFWSSTDPSKNRRKKNK